MRGYTKPKKLKSPTSREILINLFINELNKIRDIKSFGDDWKNKKQIIVDKTLFYIYRKYEYGEGTPCIWLADYNTKISLRQFKKLKKFYDKKKDEVLRNQALNKIGIDDVIGVEEPVKIDPKITSMFYDNLTEFKDYVKELEINERNK